MSSIAYTSQVKRPPPEDDRKPAAKKARGVSTPSNSNLAFDSIALVMEYLPPRDLYHMAFTCKALRDRVKVPLVVRSAMIHGGHSCRTARELNALMQKMSIYVPSPLRLLRLVNGKRCEFCKCAKVNFVRPNYGVFACWECLTDRGLTKVFKSEWARCRHNPVAYNTVFQHDRAFTGTYGYGGKRYFWTRKRRDKGGELIGPIVCFDDIDAMVAYHGDVDSYLKYQLRAPSKHAYQEFYDTYQQMEERAKQVQKERADKAKATKEQKGQNRLNKVHKMIEDLRKLLDEPFQEAALDTRDEKPRTTKDPCVYFYCPLVRKLMDPYVISPSKLKMKVLQEIADTINNKLRMIESKRLLSFEFLDENDSFERKLKSWWQEEFPNLKAILESDNIVSTDFWGHYDGSEDDESEDNDFFEKLEHDHLWSALFHLNYDKLPSDVFLSESEKTDEALSTMADTVWKMELKKAKDGASYRTRDKSYFQDVFRASTDFMEMAKVGLVAYRAWLAKKFHRNDWEHCHSRDFSLDYAVKDERAIRLIHQQDWDGLEKIVYPKRDHYLNVLSY